MKEHGVRQLSARWRQVWAALHAGISPQIEICRENGHDLCRDKLRRGRLLGTFTIISLGLNLVALFATLFPHPVMEYLPAAAVGIGLQIISIFPNRRGRVNLAVALYLSATAASCAVIFLL